MFTRLVGAVFVSLQAPREPQLIRHLGQIPMLHKLMVDAQLRNRRVGTRLIMAAERLADVRRVGRLAVGVDIANEGAARLYVRLGYRQWAYGVLDTIREHVDAAGRIVLAPDKCFVFVKRL